MKLTNHIIWKLAEDVKRICEPLFASTGITYFDYARFSHKDKKALIICSDPQYVDFFISHELYKGGPTQHITPGYHLWQEYIDDNFLGVAKNLFHHAHGLTILNPFDTYSEIINFATHHDNAMITSFYLNHQNVINKFICYFREQAEDILKLAQKYQIDLSDEYSEKMTSVNDAYHQIEQQLFSNNNFVFTIDNKMVKLSKREIECLFYLKQGMGTKKMARLLEISPRTVESYIEALKLKLNCKSRIEVVGKVG